MPKIIVLGTKEYEESGVKNYGDCFIIDLDLQLYLYDCGSIEHAERVLKYMEKTGHHRVTIILSHNDGDHYDGINYLLEKGVVEGVYTILLYKHKYLDQLREIIGDDRRTPSGLIEAIGKKYSNIDSLSGYPLYDIYIDGKELCDRVRIVGPDETYMLKAVANDIDNRKGDTIDGETNVNATSVLLEVYIHNKKILLCGDAPFEAIRETVENYDVIQLPHHGKPAIAEKIFEATWENASKKRYIVSDNTGTSNAGSDDLDTRGYRVSNTKTDGDITIDDAFLNFDTMRTGRSWG